MSIARHFVFVFLVLPSWGCATPPADEQPSIIFHVAVPPVEARISNLDRTAPPPDDPMLVEISTEGFTRDLIAELDRVFVRVSRLTNPNSDLSEPDRLRHWIREAKALQADLLLLSSIDYKQEIECETNNYFWVNNIIWLGTGPLSLLAPDVTYNTSIRFEAEIHNLLSTSTDPRDLQLLDVSSRILRINERSAPINLSLWQRGSLWAYLTSIVKFPGWTAQRTEKARQRVQQEALAQLRAAVCQTIRENEDELRASDRVSEFFPDKSFRAFRRSNGQVQIEGNVYLRKSGRSTRMEEWNAGDDAAITFPEPEAIELGGTDYFKYRLSHSTAIPEDSETVRLLLADEQDTRRSFTLSVSNADPPNNAMLPRTER